MMGLSPRNRSPRTTSAITIHGDVQIGMVFVAGIMVGLMASSLIVFGFMTNGDQKNNSNVIGSTFSPWQPPSLRRSSTIALRGDGIAHDEQASLHSSATYSLSSSSTLIQQPQQQQLFGTLNNAAALHKNKDEDSTSALWHNIHVFVGKDHTSQLGDASTIRPSHFANATWFSQVRQDEIVSRLLHNRTAGYFVDLAANDAVHISNTYALERNLGWTGLCLEPNPIYWASLSYRTKCTVVAAVVGQVTLQTVQFTFPHRAAPQGGIVGTAFDHRSVSLTPGETQQRYTVSLQDIFEFFHVPPIIDYFSLDIEGAETFVMQSFPFDRYQFHLMTVERPDEALCHLLLRNGYVLLKQLKKAWGETLWAHQDIISSLDLTALDMDTENYKYRES